MFLVVSSAGVAAAFWYMDKENLKIDWCRVERIEQNEKKKKTKQTERKPAGTPLSTISNTVKRIKNIII